AKDYFYEVRVNVARNPSTPLDLLESLAEDELDMVRNRAREALVARDERRST
ncbi:MAG: hypothetical protein KO463_04885, partial [Candidatus Methanofastidiosa archaeon]|nr:hypothetical protein [Candidatus Methanofastidiosa archaeon]